jgi:hypothetical protein
MNLFGRNLVLFLTGSWLDDLAKGNGPFHGFGVFDWIFMEADFAQGFPATDNPGGIIDLELVVVIF